MIQMLPWSLEEQKVIYKCIYRHVKGGVRGKLIPYQQASYTLLRLFHGRSKWQGQSRLAGRAFSSPLTYFPLVVLRLLGSGAMTTGVKGSVSSAFTVLETYRSTESPGLMTLLFLMV